MSSVVFGTSSDILFGEVGANVEFRDVMLSEFSVGKVEIQMSFVVDYQFGRKVRNRGRDNLFPLFTVDCRGSEGTVHRVSGLQKDDQKS